MVNNDSMNVSLLDIISKDYKNNITTSTGEIVIYEQ